MRLLCPWLAGTVALCGLALVAPGCGDNTAALEKPVEVKKNMDPMTDMPGYKEMQKNIQTKGRLNK